MGGGFYNSSLQHNSSVLIGRLLRRKTNTASFMPFKPLYDYTHNGNMRSFEDSYQRLGLARIDILYVHDIGAYQRSKKLNRHYFAQPKDSG